MKTTTVPAQITTVEDKIAGNLTLQQMILLASPIFIDFVIYALFPTMLKLSAYKFVLMVVITIVTDLLAIRLNGKILLIWAIAVIKYNHRPRFYVYNKNNTYLRGEEAGQLDAIEQYTPQNMERREIQQDLQLSLEEVAKLEQIIANPSSNLNIAMNKKGGLYVSITEVE